MKILKKSLKIILIIFISAIIGYIVLWAINFQNVKHFSKAKGFTLDKTDKLNSELETDNYEFAIGLPSLFSFSWNYGAYYSEPDGIYNVISYNCYPSNSFIKPKDNKFKLSIVFNPTEEDDSGYQEYPSYSYIVNSDLDILEITCEQEKGQGEKIFEDTFDELVKLKDEAIKIYGEEYYR